jgi:hypothetical protein
MTERRRLSESSVRHEQHEKPKSPVEVFAVVLTGL